MKLQELESKTQIQQRQKVFENYFGQRLDVGAITRKQAQFLLKKVRGWIQEHRSTPEFHRSERNPTYLKLMVMEQALAGRVNETGPGTAPGAAMAQQSPAQQAAAAKGIDGDLARGIAKVATATGQGGQSQRLTKAIQSTVAGKTPDAASRAALAQHMTGIAALEKDPNMATRLQQMLRQASAQQAKTDKETMKEGKRKARRLREASELQQAQVVLAAQDMVDQIQKMIEQVSAMQFKDLPALVDSIRNDVGMDQAQQFNNDCTAALQGLIQNLQASKQQLEGAQGTLTGQAPVVPGQDAGSASAIPPVAEPGAEVDADLSLDANLPAEEPEELPGKALGRARR